MFESEQAARSRLQFISQLAGSTAGLSMLAACGGGLVSPGSRSLATSTAAMAGGTLLMDSPELQKLMFKTDCRAMADIPKGLAVIRDDLKNNARFVDKVHRRVVMRGHHAPKTERPTYLIGDGDGGDDGYGFFEADIPYVGYMSTVQTKPYGNDDDDGDTVYGSVFIGTPYTVGPTIWTPHVNPACNGLGGDIAEIAHQIAEWIADNWQDASETLRNLYDRYEGQLITGAELIAAAVAWLGGPVIVAILAGLGLLVGVVYVIFKCFG